MSYKRITIASGASITDEVIELTKTKFMPQIKEMGAIDYVVVQTGPDSSVIISTYAYKAAADASAAKAAAIRAESQERFDYAAPTFLEGEVIVKM